MCLAENTLPGAQAVAVPKSSRTIKCELAYYVPDRSANSISHWVNVMGKEQKSNKEAKKQPGMTPKEKKAAKKAKKNEKGRIGE